MFSLETKTVIITGATGYLGRAICKGLAEQGANIAVCSTSKSSASKLAKELIGRYDVLARGYKLNLKEKDTIYPVVQEIITDFNRIDCLVNNAYYGDASYIDELNLKTWNLGLDGTITSVVFMTNQCLKHLENSQGTIINIASMYGMISPDPKIYINEKPNPMNYGVGKAAIIQYTKYAAVHLASKNINVNAISPGPFPNKNVQRNRLFVNNLIKKVPLYRIGKPEDIAGAVGFLASKEASYITGHNLVVDGGWTIV
jgi:NAD(P)-dependent dehydrogenase (short-subunit alcohol dehydrogenase family)